MSQFSITQLDEMTEEAAEEIRSMHYLCFGEGFGMEYDPESEETGHHWWLVHEWGRPEPVAFASIVPSLIIPSHAFLMRAGVVKEARGHGLQRRLVRVRERKARALGYQGIVSYTIDNPHSANNLIECGMRMYTPSWAFAGREACYWRKDFTWH